MNEYAGRLPERLLRVDEASVRTFDARLADSSTLAFRVAYSVLRHRQDAEDVAQDALAKAYRSIHQLRDRDRFRAWLVRMTWRLAMDRRRGELRRESREQAAVETEPPDVPTSEDLAISRERAERLWRAIDALPKKLRLVIVLASMEGHDVREVAGLLAVAEGTVKSRLFEARRRLQERLR
jgi:RNA polymerase sigma-70 factor (ECF subfamily)